MNNNFAIIIDGDNIQPSSVNKVINKAKEFGNVLVKRVYGDFSNPIMKSWKEPCQQYSIDCKQIWIDKTKNSTDMYIVTDCCFDIERNHQIDNYIIASGDGDFSILISALKQIGKTVYGMSTSKSSTNKKLLNVCDRFFYLNTDTPTQPASQPPTQQPTQQPQPTQINHKKKEIKKKKDDNNHVHYRKVMNYIENYLENQDTNIKLLAQLKEIVLRKWCDFSERDYNHLSFAKFLSSNKKLKIITNGTSYYVKLLEETKKNETKKNNKNTKKTTQKSPNKHQEQTTPKNPYEVISYGSDTDSEKGD